MMKLIESIKVACLIVAMLIPCLSFTQVTILPLFQKSEYLLFDNLYQVNLINSTGSNIQGFLEIIVEDRNSGQSVLKANSPLITLSPGITNSRQLNWNNNIDFGSSQLVNSLTSTGRFSSGNYVFCYNFISKDGGHYLGVNCQEKSIKIAGVPTLISPYNKEIVEAKNPVLTWRPPLPSFNSNVQYGLVIAPYFEGQSKVEALQRNFSFVQMSQINRPFQIYPFEAPHLESGKRYVWQVKAFIDGFEIGATEIWEFQYQIPEVEEESTHTENFHFVKSFQDASYYVADKKICMAYKNRNNEDKLKYKISPKEDMGSKIQDLPEVTLKAGTNKIVIEGDKIEGLRHMEQYTLTIKAKNRKKYYLSLIHI